MKLVREYQHFDRWGKPTASPSESGSRSVVDEYIVLSPGERRVFSYLTVVVGGTLLLSELALMLNVLLSWSLTGSHSIVSPAVWGWKILWLVIIGLIVMPLTALGTAATVRHTWVTQSGRIKEERTKSQALVKRGVDEDEMRHRARQALLTAAENGVYDAIQNGKSVDVRALKTLEAAAKGNWEPEQY